MSESQKDKVMGQINKIRSNIESFISDVNVNELKASLNLMVKDAQKDLTKLVDKDLGTLKTRFAKERTILEKKAKKFYEKHQKEIDALQTKFDKLIKANSKKSPAKATSAATGTKKKPALSKKVAKATKKVATKK